MKVKIGILAGVLALLLAACNHDGDPLGVPYFSTVVFLENDTSFTEQSIGSRELYYTLYTQVAEVSREYAQDTVLVTTWGERDKFYHTNDSLELVRFYNTKIELDSVIREKYDAEKIDVARDGSFVLRLSVFVSRDKKIAESHSINYVFNRYNQ